MSSPPSAAVQRVRDAIDHPVIDTDGHVIEYLPLVRDLVAEIAGSDVAGRFDQMVTSSTTARQVPDELRRQAGVTRNAWWGVPTRNTLDRATAMLPGLLYDRLDEIGIDLALLYPTYGLTVTAFPDDELRQAWPEHSTSTWFRLTLTSATGSFRWRPSRCSRHKKRSPNSITRWESWDSPRS